MSSRPVEAVDFRVNVFLTVFSFSFFSSNSLESFSASVFFRNFCMVLGFSRASSINSGISYFCFIFSIIVFGSFVIVLRMLVKVLSFLYISIISSLSFAVTLLRLNWICPLLIFRTLQTIFLFGATYSLKFLILPAAISEKTILPSPSPSISTKTVVPSIFLTVQRTTSFSFISIGFFLPLLLFGLFLLMFLLVVCCIGHIFYRLPIFQILFAFFYNADNLFLGILIYFLVEFSLRLVKIR